MKDFAIACSFLVSIFRFLVSIRFLSDNSTAPIIQHEGRWASCFSLKCCSVLLKFSTETFGRRFWICPTSCVCVCVCRLMFWSDWRDDARIERARMDGTDRRVIVDETSGPLKYLNGLTLDFRSDRLFFCDAGTDRIESVQLDGSDRQLVRVIRRHAYGIALFRDTLYWTDWQTKSIYTADKTGGSVTKHVGDLDQPYGVRVFSHERQPGEFASFISLTTYTATEDSVHEKSCTGQRVHCVGNLYHNGPATVSYLVLFRFLRFGF